MDLAVETYSSVTTSTQLNALTGTKFALLEDGNYRYLAFHNIVNADIEKLKKLKKGQVFRINSTLTWNILGEYNVTKKQIRVSVASQRTGLTDGSNYDVKVDQYDGVLSGDTAVPSLESISIVVQ